MSIFSFKRSKKNSVELNHGRRIKRAKKEEVEVVELPEEVSLKILLMLDGRSLHCARQVSKAWNVAIEREVLGSVAGRQVLMKTLQQQWKVATPTRTDQTFGDLGRPQVLALTDQFAVILSELPGGYNRRRFMVRMVKTRDGEDVVEYYSEYRPEALISKEVLLLALDRRPRGWKILAWNFLNFKKIMEKSFICSIHHLASSSSRLLFDRCNKEFLLEGRRFKIKDGKISELTSPLEKTKIENIFWFSHPHYVSRQAYELNLWEAEGSKLRKVSSLGSIALDPVYSVQFCPTRNLLITCLLNNVSRFKVSSSLTGELLREIKLTLPDPIISKLKVNDNQLTVVTVQGSQPVLLVYELDSLLSEARLEDISPRQFVLQQPGVNKLKMFLTQTSAVMTFESDDAVKVSTFDFWK